MSAAIVNADEQGHHRRSAAAPARRDPNTTTTSVLAHGAVARCRRRVSEMNIGFTTAKNSASLPLPLEEQVLAGAIDLKHTRDWGQRAGDRPNSYLEVARRHDLRVIHTRHPQQIRAPSRTTLRQQLKGRAIHPTGGAPVAPHRTSWACDYALCAAGSIADTAVHPQ